MVEPLQRFAHSGTLHQHTRSVHIVREEGTRIAEAQIDMCHGRQVEDRVYLMHTHASRHIRKIRDIAMEEFEVWPALQHTRIVPRAAIVELVERDHIVSIGILDYKMSDEPRATAGVQRKA